MGERAARKWLYGVSFTRAICRSSSVVFIEQNFGPHMLQ
jgi:hypothetical protein